VSPGKLVKTHWGTPLVTNGLRGAKRSLTELSELPSSKKPEDTFHGKSKHRLNSRGGYLSKGSQGPLGGSSTLRDSVQSYREGVGQCTNSKGTLAQGTQAVLKSELFGVRKPRQSQSRMYSSTQVEVRLKQRPPLKRVKGTNLGEPTGRGKRKNSWFQSVIY